MMIFGGAIVEINNSTISNNELTGSNPFNFAAEGAGIWVPATALVRAPRGLWACYVVGEDGLVARREVSVVHTDGARVYVRGTLRSGERVIRSGAHRVVQGQHVAVEG